MSEQSKIDGHVESTPDTDDHTHVEIARRVPSWSGQIRHPTSAAGRHLQRIFVFGSMIAVVAFVVLATSGQLSTRPKQGTSLNVFGPIDIARSTQLDLDLNALTVSASGKPAKTVKPRTGPDLDVVVRGSGRVDAPGDRTEGRRFLIGGNQSTNTAFLTARGDKLSRFFSPIGGQLTFETTPLVDLTQRTSPMGRNDTVYVQLVGDDQPRNDTDRLATNLLGVVLVIDRQIGPYLSVSINGAAHAYLIPPAQRDAFSSGKDLELSVRWTRGYAQLLINQKTVDTFGYPMTSRTVTTRARLSIGASADFGGGLFSTHDDSLRRVYVSNAVGPAALNR
jgi:hypothetical protein